MTDEQRKEICKAYFYGYTVKQIAEIEEISEKDVHTAIEWGRVYYFDELKGRGE